MKLIFKGNYKSLSDFESDELSDFTVITGKNGSGKTQLINCIRNFKNNDGSQNYQLEFIPAEKNIVVANLSYNSQGAASSESIRPILHQYQQQLSEIKQDILNVFSNLYTKKHAIEQVMLEDFYNTTSKESPEYNLKKLLHKYGFSVNAGFPTEELIARSHKILSRYTKLNEVLTQIAKYKNKSFLDISENDFLTTPLLEKYIDNASLLNSQIELIFYSYLLRKRQNTLMNYLNEKQNGEYNTETFEEFDARFPAPWIIINNILNKYFPGLKVDEYSIIDISEMARIEIRFRKSQVPNTIPLSDLSSGEQIIVGLALKLFTKEYYEGNLDIPKVLVLDEPDAYLHPEMSKLLIEVLQNSFVKELGIKVIITTHSASTVALALDESIYEMNNEYRSCSLKKISKDTALSLLTAKIPTLSIDYKNHRQIFVESPTDIMYYQKVFNRLAAEEKLAYKLYFISNERGNSNSAWVEGIVKQLRESGVSRAYGILDWDGKNKSTSSTFVHGENSRYSIENFIFDPLYLSILLSEMEAHSINQELTIDTLKNSYSLHEYTQDILQNRVDWIVKKITAQFLSLKSEEITEVLYYNGLALQIPKWYISMKGHELEEKIRNTFSSLARYPDSVSLNQKLTIILARCYPVVPIDSVTLLKDLST
jgi:energy-coupling factor transporter ATP-binding protein EcfA2